MPHDDLKQPTEAAAGSGGLAGDDLDSPLQADLDRLRAELDEANKRALRNLADLENYRKRADRTVEEERRYACLPLLRDLLPALDNIKRAIEASQQTPDVAALREGMQLVERQLEGILAKHRCNPILSLHQPFDPNLHDALLQQPSAEFPPNTVLQEVQKGFTLHERVVRPSQVIVSTSPPSQDG